MARGRPGESPAQRADLAVARRLAGAGEESPRPCRNAAPRRASGRNRARGQRRGRRAAATAPGRQRKSRQGQYRSVAAAPDVLNCEGNRIAHCNSATHAPLRPPEAAAERGRSTPYLRRGRDYSPPSAAHPFRGHSATGSPARSLPAFGLRGARTRVRRGRGMDLAGRGIGTDAHREERARLPAIRSPSRHTSPTSPERLPRRLRSTHTPNEHSNPARDVERPRGLRPSTYGLYGTLAVPRGGVRRHVKLTPMRHKN